MNQANKVVFITGVVVSAAFMSGCSNKTQGGTISPAVAAPVSTTPVDVTSVNTIATPTATPLPEVTATPASQPTAAPQTVYDSRTDGELSVILIDKLGRMIRSAATPSELEGVKSVVVAVKHGWKEGRPDNLDPARWPGIVSDTRFQSAIGLLQDAVIIRERMVSGASMYPASDDVRLSAALSYANQSINERKLSEASPEEQEKRREDLFNKVMKYNEQATHRKPE